MIGAQASNEQLEKILSYFDIGRQEGAQGADRRRAQHASGRSGGRLLRQADGLEGPQQDAGVPGGNLRAGRVGDHLQGRDEALSIANDTLYGLGAGVWSRDANPATALVGHQAGRVWTNCYHAYPAHAAFGGYKQSGIGRETHKMMLDHYQQTKNMLVSYSARRSSASSER
jgi:aldehyde dehydrogenase